jgi:nicotinamide-nucleotide amidase
LPPEADHAKLSYALSDEIEKLATRVLQKACDTELTIATAESCTGGLIASILTDVEGKSHAFEAGFATYSDAAKADMLGIAPDLIEQEGAVSRAVALAMAAGALDSSCADIAVAVTGYAGEAGPDGEPGLVHIACQRRGREAAHRELHCGDVGREHVRSEATLVALQLLDDGLG